MQNRGTYVMLRLRMSSVGCESSRMELDLELAFQLWAEFCARALKSREGCLAPNAQFRIRRVQVVTPGSTRCTFSSPLSIVAVRKATSRSKSGGITEEARCSFLSKPIMFSYAL